MACKKTRRQFHKMWIKQQTRKNQQVKNMKTKTIEVQRFREFENLKQTLNFESSRKGQWTLRTFIVCTKVKYLSLIPKYASHPWWMWKF
jgi:hypothetical protein